MRGQDGNAHVGGMVEWNKITAGYWIEEIPMLGPLYWRD